MVVKSYGFHNGCMEDSWIHYDNCHCRVAGYFPQIYEAASIDGAEKSQVFRYITLPLLRPTLVLALILSLAGSFKAFDHFYIMTKGGPLKTTETIVMYINKIGFEFYDIGFGSAVSVIFLGILLLISYLQLKAGGFQNE